jgi:hypothetical protein
VAQGLGLVRAEHLEVLLVEDDPGASPLQPAHGPGSRTSSSRDEDRPALPRDVADAPVEEREVEAREAELACWSSFSAKGRAVVGEGIDRQPTFRKAGGTAGGGRWWWPCRRR